MSTRSLLLWVALVAGAELAVRGYLAAEARGFHAGLWLLVSVFATLGWRARRGGRGVAALAAGMLAAAFAGLSLAELLPGGAAPTPPEESAATPRPAAAPSAGLARSVDFPADAFAVVVLDEPGAAHDAWPRVLQARLDRLECRKPPVVRRTTRADLALAAKPDVILTRLRCDDLEATLDAIPEASIGPAPRIPPRASRLGRAIETAVARRRFGRAWQRALAVPTGEFELRTSTCTRRYRAVVDAARRKRAHVVLLTPSLAANEHSGEATLRSLEAEHPDLRRQVLLARLSKRVVRSIAGSFAAQIVDAGGLDGVPELFDDPFTPGPAGLERLADDAVEALGSRLSRPAPGCQPVQ